MYDNSGYQKVIFLQGRRDGIGYEKNRKIKESHPRLPQEIETQMLYLNWVMGHTLEYITINFLISPPGVYHLQMSDVGRGRVTRKGWFIRENFIF